MWYSYHLLYSCANYWIFYRQHKSKFSPVGTKMSPLTLGVLDLSIYLTIITQDVSEMSFEGILIMHKRCTKDIYWSCSFLNSLKDIFVLIIPYLVKHTLLLCWKPPRINLVFLVSIIAYVSCILNLSFTCISSLWVDEYVLKLQVTSLVIFVVGK